MREELTHEDVLKLIPHRHPFLLVDGLRNIADDLTSASGYKRVEEGAWFFEGHFPGKPIMPGVLIVEALAQTAGALCSYKKIMKSEGKLGNQPPETLFISIDSVRFKRPVLPNTDLELQVNEIYYDRRHISKYSGEAMVAGEQVAAGVFCAKHIL